MTKLAEKISTQGQWVVRRQSHSTGRFVTVSEAARASKSRASKEHTAAVYAYLRALRATGKRNVSASDVASALDLPERETRKILASMSDKGVKLAR
jgi:hypothetical protein